MGFLFLGFALVWLSNLETEQCFVQLKWSATKYIFKNQVTTNVLDLISIHFYVTLQYCPSPSPGNMHHFFKICKIYAICVFCFSYWQIKKGLDSCTHSLVSLWGYKRGTGCCEEHFTTQWKDHKYLLSAEGLSPSLFVPCLWTAGVTSAPKPVPGANKWTVIFDPRSHFSYKPSVLFLPPLVISSAGLNI